MVSESFDTAVTRLLGIRYPIIQGGMQWVGRAELASAVSNAGGLGILTGLTQPTPDALAAEIARCKSMTDKPFGVNLTMLPTSNAPPYEQYFDVALEGGASAIETAGIVPPHFFTKAKDAGVPVLHKCTTVRHALSAERKGVDVISIDGFEAAGHPGEDDVPGLVLVPAAVRALKVPVIASGGIGSGAGLAAALVLGAAGINMGTRFCATKEAPIHPSIKQALVNGSETDTNLIFRTLRNTARVLKNEISEEVVTIERREGGATFTDIAHLVAGTRGRAALESGDINGGLVWASQVMGLIDDVPSCEDLIQTMVTECVEQLSAAQQMVRQ